MVFDECLRPALYLGRKKQGVAGTKWIAEHFPVYNLHWIAFFGQFS